MNHRAHHLYNLIRWICEEKGQCTASRETLARALGDSPKSLRLITEALQELKAEYLIEIQEREMAPNLITLTEHHDSYYNALLLA